MPSASAGRPPHGKVRKDHSKTALFAYVCAELEQRRSDPALLAELGLDLTVTAIQQAVRGRRHGTDTPQRELAGVADVAEGPIFRAWQLVDESALGIAVALLRLYPRGSKTSDRLRHQRELVRWLRKSLCVRQLLISADGRLVTAVVLYDEPARREQSQVALDDLGCAWDWDEVAEETWEPAPNTWRWLTKRQAKRDGLGL